VVPTTVERGESQAWAELLVVRAYDLWELEWETWLGAERELRIGDRCVRHGSGSRSLRMGYLLLASLLLLRSLRLDLHLRLTVYH
jgi:hypothetical protein